MCKVGVVLFLDDIGSIIVDFGVLLVVVGRFVGLVVNLNHK